MTGLKKVFKKIYNKMFDAFTFLEFTLYVIVFVSLWIHPSIIINEVNAKKVILLFYPFIIFITGFIHGFRITYSYRMVLVISLFFALIIFLFYNPSGYAFIPIYAFIHLIGQLLGRKIKVLFMRRDGYRDKW